MFSLLYYILSVVLYILALPLLIFLSFKQKYKESVPARFFLKDNPPFKENNNIWFHVCSLGEARALKPILTELKQKVSITTITQTGQNEAKKYDAEVRYLPYEMFLPFWAKKHKLLVVLEAEFWYMLFLVMRKKGSKIVLLNARISDKSAPKYKKMAWFYRKIFENVDMILAQSQVDKERLLALGAKNVEVVGNIKLLAKIAKTKNYTKPNCEVIVAGSTHDGEEELILKAFLSYKKQNKDAKLIVVPRHPERFENVYELLKKSNLKVDRFSQTKDFKADIILVDMMGELNNIYAISDIAVLGGAFRDDVGGHNPLEPAHFGCKIISGEHFFHQKELFKYIKNIQIVKNDKITKALENAKELKPSYFDKQIDIDKIISKLKEMS